MKKHLKKKMFFNLCEERSLVKAVKEILNVNFSWLMIDVRSFNVQATSLDMQFSDISDLKNEIKKKNTVFVNVNVIRQ